MNIPATINGLPVTSIGDRAFYNDVYYEYNYYYHFILTSVTSVTIPDSVTSIGDEAFAECFSLTSATIGSGVTSIGDSAFYDDFSLTSVHFRGNAPLVYPYTFEPYYFPTLYYLPGATGWSSTYGSALWLPQVQTGDDNFGVKDNQFGFNISWASGQTVALETSTDLSAWTPITTNTLANDSFYFSDPQSSNFPGRFYRRKQLAP